MQHNPLESQTQLTLRTFHVGGIAGNISEENKLAKFDGTVELEDLKVVPGKDADGNDAPVVISRTTEFKLNDSKTGIALSNVSFLMVHLYLLKMVKN